MEENITPENQEDQAPPTGEPAEAADVAPVEPPAEPVAGPIEVEPPAAPEAAAAEAKTPAAKPVAGERKWYVIQTFTGQEDKAKKALEQTIIDEGLKDRVFQVLVPVEDVVEIKGGKRVERVNKMFPGYVFLDMVLDDTTWYMIRQTNGVARFIGSKVQPTPVSEKEMQRVLKQLGKQERLEVSFERGEGVRVISGPFRGYTGTIDEINSEKGKMKVLINIFGRDTPVEVNFEHAQKIN
ncbi:MAG: transcription termination/antitermination protein NusG [Candidatus Margulisiibacteriota bacterium]